MSYDAVKTAIALQTMIRSIPGIKEAPAAPPENMNQFPFSLVYVKNFTSLGGSSGWDEIIDVFAIEIHVSRNNLPANYPIALGYRTKIHEKLIADPTIGGTVETFTDFSGTFGFLQYGGHENLGWQLSLSVKGKISC